MSILSFNTMEHQCFYESMLNKVACYDVYHQAFFYCMGVCEVTRKHIDELFDFDEGSIRIENIDKPFQTGTSYKVTRIAYNLWNGFIEEEKSDYYTPSELFCCEFAQEFQQAVRLRYPNYFNY